MNIENFIKSSKDRLFIVDNDCYIIYSGDGALYEKPFIRIGNWKDMPVELIPKIETIILSEKISGNPYYEQFNIDLTAPEQCVYIGRKKNLGNLFEFMKTFDIDLTEASSINIEKDIPAFSRQKIISGNNEFIGLFLENGNFLISYNDDEILNIDKIENDIFTVNKILDKLHIINSRCNLYEKSGFIILNHKPIFYHRHSFTLFQFTEPDYENLLNLNIDPLKIKTVINLNSSCAALFPLLKWLSKKGETLNLISDSGDELFRLQNIFNNIQAEKFSGLEFSPEKNYSIKKSDRSDNIKITVKADNSENETLTITCINDSHGINEITDEKTDIIILNYSLYEKINLIFKSTEIPLAIIDDGNPNISKAESTGKIILRESNRYEIEKHSEFESIDSKRFIDNHILSLLLDYKIENEKDIIAFTENDENNLKYSVTLFNIRAMTYLLMKNTSDRNKAMTLNRLASDLGRKINNFLLQQNSFKIKSTLILFNSSLSHFISICNNIKNDADNSPGFLNSKLKELKKRIKKDRERLKNLLSLLDVYSDETEKIRHRRDLLIKSIEERKKQILNPQHTSGFYKDVSKRKTFLNKEDRRVKINNIKKSKNIFPGNLTFQKWKDTKLRLLLIFSGFLILSAVLLFLSRAARENQTGPKPQETNKSDIVKINRENLIKKYRIKIHDKYIYRYANKLALKNSYHRISFHGANLKSPDLIFPGDTLTMLDGTKISVSKGDTLWKISEKRLIERSVKFYKLIEMIKEAEPDRKKELISKAEKYIITEKQNNILNTLKIKADEINQR